MRASVSGLTVVWDKVPLQIQHVCACINERNEMEMGRMEENGDCLTSCTQMTWFCVGNHKKPQGDWGGILLRCEVNTYKRKVMVLCLEDR